MPRPADALDLMLAVWLRERQVVIGTRAALQELDEARNRAMRRMGHAFGYATQDAPAIYHRDPIATRNSWRT